MRSQRRSFQTGPSYMSTSHCHYTIQAFAVEAYAEVVEKLGVVCILQVKVCLLLLLDSIIVATLMAKMIVLPLSAGWLLLFLEIRLVA